jgi:hypothetical protein
MHHVEDNMPEDLSSTMRYQRDSFLHFLHYFLPLLLPGDHRAAHLPVEEAPLHDGPPRGAG